VTGVSPYSTKIQARYWQNQREIASKHALLSII